MSASQDEWGDYMTPESQDYLFAFIEIHDSRIKYHNDVDTITQFQTDYGRWIVSSAPTRMRKRFQSQEEIRTFVLQLVSDISNLLKQVDNVDVHAVRQALIDQGQTQFESQGVELEIYDAYTYLIVKYKIGTFPGGAVAEIYLSDALDTQGQRMEPQTEEISSNPRTPDTRTAPQIPRAPIRSFATLLWTVIRINYGTELQFHRKLHNIREFRSHYEGYRMHISLSEDNNRPINIIRLHMRFESREEFKRFVIQLGRYIQYLYLKPENVDENALLTNLRYSFEVLQEDPPADARDLPGKYTYPIVEYKFDTRTTRAPNMAVADIIVRDALDLSGQGSQGIFREINDAEEERELTKFYNEKEAKEAKEQGVKLREVKLGETFSLDEFRKLGPFCIERRLIYDDLSTTGKDKAKLGCANELGYNYEYPVLVKGSATENGEINEKNNQVYCITDVLQWNVEYNKDTDQNTRQYIKEIRIMNEKDIEEEEMKEVTKEEYTLVKRAMEAQDGREDREIRKELKAIQSKLNKNTEEKKKRKQEKIRRMKMARLMLFYKKLKF